MNNPHLMMLCDACTHMISTRPYIDAGGRAWLTTRIYLEYLNIHDYDHGELGEAITDYEAEPEKYHDEMLTTIRYVRGHAMDG